MTHAATSYFFMQPLPHGKGAPEWVHILPVGQFSAVDGRGPYDVIDAEAIIAASFAGGGPLVVDVNHATNTTGGAGFEAPAFGWITELQARDTGIWAKVDWTEKGRQALTDRQYRGMSAVVHHTEDGRVLSISGASLTNNPAVPGLTANFSRHPKKEDPSMSFLAKLAAELGLKDGVTEDAVMSTFAAKLGSVKKADETMQELASLFSVTADIPSILAAAKAVTTKAKEGETATASLQSQVSTLQTELTAMKDATAKKEAEVFVDAAIAAGRMGINKENRADFVQMHIDNQERAEKLISSFAVVSGRTRAGDVPPRTPEKDELNPRDIAAKATAYFTKQQEAGCSITFDQAVLHVTSEAAA